MEIPASRITSLETGSGIPWNKWLEFLEPHKNLDHTAMAKVVLEHINKHGESKSPEWWAQGVTVAFEQHIGRRGIGERCNGKYSVTCSKTLTGTMDQVLERLVAAGAGRDEFAGVPVDGEPTTSATEKWRYYRIKLADGARVSINVQTKPAGNKSTVAVNHDNLDDNSRIAEIKTWWKDWLATI